MYFLILKTKKITKAKVSCFRPRFASTKTNDTTNNTVSKFVDIFNNSYI